MNEINFKQKVLRTIIVLLSLIFSMTFVGCGTMHQIDKCCDTDVVYVDEIEDGTTSFTTLNYSTIRLHFRPIRPRFHWGHNYGYWGSRPLWLDFDYYHGFNNYYSYYNPYYSYYRPWNVWDWYMKPWRPANNWYQGPFNNQNLTIMVLIPNNHNYAPNEI
jgi:hypothetical protein